MTMNSYLIESLAPLVFRSGKPFGSQASAQDVIFPLPSAGAGLVRALAIGQDKLVMSNNRLNHHSMKTDENYQKVLATKSRGPFLIRYKDEGKYTETDKDIDILVPKPKNSLYFESKKTGNVELIRLIPKAFKEQEQGLCGSDLPNNLLPVQIEQDIKGKPKSGAIYWTLQHLIEWQQGKKLSFDEVNTQGLTQLPIDIRTHVAIDGETQASEDSKLFQTASFDLTHQHTSHQRKNFTGESSQNSQSNIWSDYRFGFVVQTDVALDNDLATFGGERRLSHFKKIALSAIHADKERKQSLSKIKADKGFSLTFLTPTIFAQGYLPEWINEDTMTGTIPDTNLQVRLKSIAIDRWQGVSGWDSILWKPKATRKAVCAGSVYWFELINADSLGSANLQQLEQRHWSDNSQDQNDGFGVALLSPCKID